MRCGEVSGSRGVKVVGVESTSRGDGPVALISQLRNIQNSGSIPTVPGQLHQKGSPNTHGGLMFTACFHETVMHNSCAE